MWEFVLIGDDKDDESSLMIMLMLMIVVMVILPGGSELDPLVEESPIVELAEKT